MSIFEKARFEIWNQSQHPYKHTLGDFAYFNKALPAVVTLEGALNAIVANMYPNTQDEVATVLDLPTVGNNLNDYRVVLDDGDGKGAGYRWEQREGDIAPKWYKIYDMDWGEDSILSNFLTKTNDTYVSKKGQDEIDSDGNVVTGDLAGQYIYGGHSANTNLTLYANSGDGTGVNTGFVQFGDNLRPITDDLLGLGTATKRFKDGYLSGFLQLNNVKIDGEVITSDTGSIDFADENLSTSGIIEAGSLLNQSFEVYKHIATPANPAATYSSLYFKADGKLYRLDDLGNEFVVGLGLTSTNDNRLIKSDGTGGTAIQETGISISDTNEMSGVTKASIDNLDLDGNTISSVDIDGDINVTPNGAGNVVVPNLKISTVNEDKIQVQDVNGVLEATNISINNLNEMFGLTRLTVDNLILDGNTLISSDINGNISILPNGSGTTIIGGNIEPSLDNSQSLGASSKRLQNLFMNGHISDGTNLINLSTLLSFRDALVGAADGHALFYNSTSGKWTSSLPDSEIDHGTLNAASLTDDDHLQYVKKDGRAGGQTIQGGTATSESLILESTSNATKGTIQFKDNITPDVDASFTTVWTGKDVGAAAKRLRNVYSAGEFIGFRFQNITTATMPASSSNNKGRAVFNTDDNSLYVDTGLAMSQVIGGSKKFAVDQSFDGIVLTKDVVVSSAVDDARICIIQLLDNNDDFERVNCSLKAISATTVRITTNTPLPAGSYRLIVME